MKGVSFVVAIGKSGGLHFKADEVAIRACFWWIAFTLYFIDIEACIEALVKKVEAKK